MQPTTFPCPCCSAPLRVQDRMYIGKQVPCPDCNQPIRIVADGPKRLAAERVQMEERAGRRRKAAGNLKSAAAGQSAETAATTTASPAAATADDHAAVPEKGRSGKKNAGKRRPKRAEKTRGCWAWISSEKTRRLAVQCRDALTSPLGVAWSVAGACALLFAYLIVSHNAQSPRRTATIDGSQTVQQSRRDGAADGRGEETKRAGGDDLRQDDVEARMNRLAAALTEYVEEHGRFPSGTVVRGELPLDDRFSWLSVLAADFENARVAPPQWELAWHHASNERFVRRSLPLFLNPAVRTLVDPQGYPATHFVGMAGVGADAARLPVDHPRAGIFGYRRRTRPEDVKDGLSNTMMVVGLREPAGSWAAGGAATIRGLVREPYINGPDGFGTGQADGMHVLMADGSVRFVSQETSPTILRRMAAMADGLDLNPNTPGEPGDPSPSSPRRDPAIAQNEIPDDPSVVEPPPAPMSDGPPGANQGAEVAKRGKPVGRDPSGEQTPEKQPPREQLPQPKPDEPLEPEEEPVDVAAALEQKILRFDQSPAAPLSELLLLLEEMAGVPIRYDPQNVDPARLEKTVRLKLERTTVGGILQAVLEGQGLSYEIVPTGIRVFDPNAL